MPDYRQLTPTTLNPVTPCTACGPPPQVCGGSVSIPAGATGYYNLDFDAGNTISDTGAIVVYFNPQGVPDGIRVLYDNVFYNTVTNNTEGRMQTPSGVTGAFTILGMTGMACMPSSYPNTQSYTFYDGIVNGAWNNTGATQSITINQGDYIGGGVSQFNTLVIPKTSATPSVVSIQVLGHCPTGWNILVSCPAALPSVLASTAQLTDACNSTQNVPVYFAQNYGDTNTAPDVGNFVFTDENGATPLNNTSTVYYYITGTTAFSVLNGVVVSKGNCASGGGSQLRISDCQTGNTWTMENTYGHVLTDVLQYQQGTPGQGTVYCGTVTQVNVSGTNDATVNGAQSYDCSDATHCLQ